MEVDIPRLDHYRGTFVVCRELRRAGAFWALAVSDSVTVTTCRQEYSASLDFFPFKSQKQQDCV